MHPQPESIIKILRNISAILLVLILTTETGFTQVVWDKKSLTRGKLWVTLWNSLQYGDPTETENSFFTMDYPGYSKGANIRDALNYCEAAGYIMYGERNGTAFGYTINSRFFPSGEHIFPIAETMLERNYNLKNLNIYGEEIITGGHHINGMEVDINRRSMVWSIPKYDDFVIHEVTIFNTEFSTLNDVYFGMRYGIRITQRSGTRQDEKYDWDPQREMFYFYDDRSYSWESEIPIEYTFGVGPERGDIADARDIWTRNSREHELDAAGYFSAVILDAAGANVYQNILEHVGQGVTEGASIEDIMVVLGVDLPPRYKEVITHQQPRVSWDDARAAGVEGGNKFERRPEFVISAGPFTIPAFSTVKIVFAEVMGEMDRDKIVEGGVANIDLLARASRDSLFKNTDAAMELYASNYIPDYLPPPTPTDGENSLLLTTLPGEIIVEWPPVPDSYTDPLTGMNDLAGYRLYRSTYFTIGPWDLIAELPRETTEILDGMIRYSDNNLPYGVGNYYSVTTYDTEGHESGKVNRNRFPIYPLRAPNEDFPKNVFVVPNPFKQHSGLEGTGDRYRMEFIGIPSKCRIKIFTVTGDLLQEIYHDDGSGSVAWGSNVKADYQLTKWSLRISPGIYIYSVESLVEGHTGEKYIGKLAIVK